MKRVFFGCFLLLFAVVPGFGDGKYKVGDLGPGGGIVFYVSEEGFKVYDGKGGEKVCHYLEMTSVSLGKSQWLPKDEWAVGTKEGLGYGKANTYEILKMADKLSLDKESCAAYRASQYSTPTTKKGDWWLPSKEELNLMYENVRERVLATLLGDSRWHWSSNESDWGISWSQDFDYGHQYDLLQLKEINYSVRAVRAF